MASRPAVLAATAIWILAIIAPASALTRWADPSFGKATLSTGFGAVAIPLTAGGPLDAAGQGGLPAGCSGFLNVAPDFRFQYEGGTAPLVVSATAEVGTTLVVDAPGDAGGWLCGAGGDAPATVTIAAPTAGVYNVWVGTIAEVGRHSVVLELREGDAVAGQAISGPSLRPDAEPLFGAAAVTFPLTRIDAEVAAGGNVHAAKAVGPGCAGYITDAPTYRVTVTPTETSRLLLRVRQAGTDTTLVIRQPDGTWRCADDDVTTLDATVTYRPPAAGTYDIWIGTYAPSPPVPAVLRITEPGGAG